MSVNALKGRLKLFYYTERGTDDTAILHITLLSFRSFCPLFSSARFVQATRITSEVMTTFFLEREVFRNVNFHPSLH